MSSKGFHIGALGVFGNNLGDREIQIGWILSTPTTSSTTETLFLSFLYVGVLYEI